jgi:hypothetical protein
VEDFVSILEGEGFSMGKVVKDLLPAVAKVKVQMKSPFGKPKDGDKTSVGLSVGCIKSLPESPAEIQGLLKDIALKVGLDFVVEAVEGGYDDDEHEDEKKGLKFGVRAGFNLNKFSFGYKDWDKKEMGYSIGVGLALNVPIVSFISLNTGLNFYYRELFNWEISDYYIYSNWHSYDSYFGDLNDFAISIPVLLQFGSSFYFVTGIQLDIPFAVESSTTRGDFGTEDGGGGYHFTDNRSSVDVGFVLGLGYMFKNFGFDFRYVYGLTGLFKDFSYYDNDIYNDYKDKSWLGQYCLGVFYFF